MALESVDRSALLGDDARRRHDTSIAVLLCTTDRASARSLARMLESVAPDVEVVHVATRGCDAESAVASLLPDIVLMDIGLVDGSATEVTRRVRAMSPSTKVLMLTTGYDARALFLALRAGASGYVTSESDAREIATAVRSVHRSHHVIPPHVAAEILTELESGEAGVLPEEREILVSIAGGRTIKEIASALGIGERLVRRRVDDIYAKLHFSGRSDRSSASLDDPHPVS